MKETMQKINDVVFLIAALILVGFFMLLAAVEEILRNKESCDKIINFLVPIAIGSMLIAILAGINGWYFTSILLSIISIIFQAICIFIMIYNEYYERTNTYEK